MDCGKCGSYINEDEITAIEVHYLRHTLEQLIETLSEKKK